jgi:hypothetical protein
MTSATCPRCQIHKDSSEFYVNLGNQNGLDVYCKICRKAYQAEYYQRTKSRKSMSGKTQNRGQPYGYVKVDRADKAIKDAEKAAKKEAVRLRIEANKIKLEQKAAEVKIRKAARRTKKALAAHAVLERKAERSRVAAEKKAQEKAEPPRRAPRTPEEKKSITNIVAASVEANQLKREMLPWDFVGVGFCHWIEAMKGEAPPPVNPFVFTRKLHTVPRLKKRYPRYPKNWIFKTKKW